MADADAVADNLAAIADDTGRVPASGRGQDDVAQFQANAGRHGDAGQSVGRLQRDRRAFAPAARIEATLADDGHGFVDVQPADAGAATGADDQGAAGPDALDRSLDAARAGVAAAVDQDDLLAAGGKRAAVGGLVAGIPAGAMRAVVPAARPVLPPALARGRIQQQAEVRAGLAFDPGGGLGLNLGSRDREAGGEGYGG